MAEPGRPDLLVVIAGTGTEIGKTWLTAHIARDLRARGRSVSARKPAQSFDPGDAVTDAHVLAEATGEHAKQVCAVHRWYEVPMAPPMAASALGREAIWMEDLAGELRWPIPQPEFGLVETAGGVRSPLAHDGDSITLIELLQPDIVVVVADAGLGTINATLLSLEALDRGAHVAREVVFLNRYDGADDLHRRNLAWLVERAGVSAHTGVTDMVGMLEVARSARSGSENPRRPQPGTHPDR